MKNLEIFLLGAATTIVGILIFGSIASKFDRPVPAPISQSEITWVTNPVLVKSELAKESKMMGKKLQGIADSNLQDDTCTIYVAIPKGKDDRVALQMLGHEVLHCFSGAYHK